MLAKKSSKMLLSLFVGFIVLFSMNSAAAVVATDVQVTYGTCSDDSVSRITSDNGVYLVVVCKQTLGIGKVDVLVDIDKDNANWIIYDYYMYDTGSEITIRFNTDENGWSSWYTMDIGYHSAYLPEEVRGDDIVEVQFRRTIVGYWEFRLDYLYLN